MKLYQKFIVGEFILAGLIGLYGCKPSNASERNRGSRLECFLDRGMIGHPRGGHHFAGVGVALGDMDGDGDLDMVTATYNKIKYFENVGTKDSPSFSDLGIIGNPKGGHHFATIGITLADLDSDGDLDIVTGSYDRIKYFENTLPQKKQQ